MSDVTVLYNKQAVSLEDLRPLINVLRPAIAKPAGKDEAAILFQFSAPDLVDGYADIDISVTTSADDTHGPEINGPIKEAVSEALRAYVQDRGLSGVTSIGCVARTADGAAFFESLAQ